MQLQTFLRFLSNMMKLAPELYTGYAFPAYELAPVADRHHGTQLDVKAIGTHFHWTLNQEIVFSAALTGKPLRKQQFQQYGWKRCVIGTKSVHMPYIKKNGVKHSDMET